MIYPAADKIEKQVDSKYALVILAAKRAKQIKEGSKPLIKTDSTNPLTIALEEIAAGQVRYQFDENSLAGREAISDQQAVIGRRDLEVDADPLATPEPDENYVRAAAALGADLDDLLGADDELEEVLVETDESDDEEEDPLTIADEEESEV